MQKNGFVEPDLFGSLLLDIGLALLLSGANTGRIKSIVEKIASAYHHKAHINISPNSISLTLDNDIKPAIFIGTRGITTKGVNFKIISGISRLSWSLEKKQWPLHEVREELTRLMKLPHYPRLLTLAVVGLAGAAFCYTFGGDFPEMCVTFGATFTGLFVKQQINKRSVNTYLCSFLSAIVAAIFTGAFYKLGIITQLEHAFATCVLFLIPGVPLVNSFTDLLEGHILNGLDQGVSALMHAFAIAFGLSIAMLICHYYG